jgi:hypothetical protein
VEPINLRNPEDGDDTFSEPSVRASATRYKVSKYIFNRLRVFENKMLRRILGQKRGEVPVGWSKLDKEELRDLFLRQV